MSQELTKEQMNRMIAEAVKIDSYVIVKQGAYYRPNAAGYTHSLADAWKLPKAEAKKYEMYADREDVPGNEKVTIQPAPLPDFCADLNAMAQAEAMLSDDEWDEYCEQLGGSLRGCASAPASRRSTAFCRVLQTRKGE